MDLTSILPQLIRLSIMLVVLGLGLHSSWQDALYLFRNPRILIRSLLAMNVIMPLIAAGFAVAFDLPPAMKIALVALAVSPVPPLVPKKELKAGAYAPYAVGLFFATGVLAIITVPITVAWFSSAVDRAGGIEPLKVAAIVLSSVLVPLAIGIVLRKLAPVLAAKIGRPVARLGIVLLIVTMVPVCYALWPAVHALIQNGTVVIIAILSAIGLGVGHLLGGPHSDDRTVLALSTTSRHPAMALAIAVAGGMDTKPALAAILLYVIVSALVCVPYVVWRKRQAIAAGVTVEG